MLITKVTDDSGPSTAVELTALKGVAASLALTFSAVDAAGVVTNDDLSGMRFKLTICRGTPRKPGVVLFTFDSNDDTILTTDAATGTVEPIWTATQADTIAEGVYFFKFEQFNESGELVAVPFNGYWIQEGFQ